MLGEIPISPYSPSSRQVPAFLLSVVNSLSMHDPVDGMRLLSGR